MTLPAQLDATSIHPTKDRILAVKYTRPATYGSLVLPESYSDDGTWTWWECVAAGPDVERKLGIRMLPGDLFSTPFRPPVDLGAEDAAGRRLFIIGCTVQRVESGKMVEDLNVKAVLPKTWGD